MGMLFAAYLIRTGRKVELVTRTSEQAQLIREQGLLVTAAEAQNINHNETGRPRAEWAVNPAVLSFKEAVAFAITSEKSEELPDLVFLMVKQTSITDELAVAIKKQLKPGSRLVCFQNGIGHTELLKRHIAAVQLLTAVTTEGALRRSSRHVEHTGKGMTWLGADESVTLTEIDKKIVKNTQNLLADAGFSVSLSNNITSKVWNKLMINAVINPITAVLRIRNGLIPELPAARALMRSLYEEGAALADKLEVELAPDLWEQLLEVCRLTANNQSSMLQDVLSRRRTEAGAITGGLLDKAREAGVTMPGHETMYQLLRSIEQEWETR
jgi:2-dehydropantoate 2-reductase